MADLLPLDRLQPALLDRLQDDAPEQRTETKEARVLTRAQLREAVLRDIRWLLNASRPPKRDNLAAWPEVDNSVINYGMPSFAGETVTSIETDSIERSIRDALVRFEPRIIPGSLKVDAELRDDALDWYNVISVRISVQIWAQPVPLELLLRTELNLESGQVDVRDLGGY
jgi:type VI secretion system protein ImpF